MRKEAYMGQKAQIQAAIFDMDGTIFDTEQIYRRAWLSAGVPEPLYRSYIGTPRAYIKKLLTENGFDAAYAKAESENAALLICGSLYLAGAVRPYIIEKFS